MPGTLRFFLLIPAVVLLLSACASGPRRHYYDVLEAQRQDQRVLGARVSSLEERADRLESALGMGGASPQDTSATAERRAAASRDKGAQAGPPASRAGVRTQQAGAAANPVPLGEYVLTDHGPVPAGEAASLTRESPVPYIPKPVQRDAGLAPRTAAAPGEVRTGRGPALAPLAMDAAAASRSTSAPAGKNTSAQASKTGQAAYDAALALYYKGDYARAAQGFDAFLNAAGSGKLAPNALYWKGECAYSLGKYDAAIMAFKDVASQYPRHPKAAAALLKAGYAYERLKDTDNARFYWQLLLDDFPKSEPARLARKRLSALS